MKVADKFLTLSFSGCGHLLPYHLGVSSVLLDEGSKRASKSNKKRHLPRIKAVAGSSAGAIAAVLHTRLPHRIEEYASRFIAERGHALKTLTTMLHEEENSLNASNHPSFTTITDGKREIPPSLHIATTKCIDGSKHLFSFPGTMFSSISTTWTTDKVLDAVKASCTIPQSFHPADIIFKRQNISYPDVDGIYIEGHHHVDGGIASPAPGTPRDKEEGACPIIISPISAGSPSFFSRNGKVQRRISPTDDSCRLLPISNLTCRGDFNVKPSLQNLRALRMASGLVSSTELQGWYDRGVEDALTMVKEWDEQ